MIKLGGTFHFWHTLNPGDGVRVGGESWHYWTMVLMGCIPSREAQGSVASAFPRVGFSLGDKPWRQDAKWQLTTHKATAS